MNRRPFLLFAGIAALSLPSTASACNMYLNSTFLRIPMKMDLGIGASFGDGASAFSADLGLRAGDKVVIRPAAGFCTGGGDTDFLFGGAVGIKAWKSNDGKAAINVQSGLTYDSFDGGNAIAVPIMGAVEFTATDKLSWFGGAGVEWYRVSVDVGGGYGGASASETNPAFFGGVVVKLEKVDLLGGLTIRTGDNSETAVNVGVRFPLGGGSKFRPLPLRH